MLPSLAKMSRNNSIQFHNSTHLFINTKAVSDGDTALLILNKTPKGSINEEREIHQGIIRLDRHGTVKKR